MTEPDTAVLRVDSLKRPRRPLISLIVPVLDEEETLPVFFAEVTAVVDGLADRYDFEFLFTDNCSGDRTFEVLTTLAGKDPRVRVLRFSRNFGYQRSIYTGYVNARGDAAVQLDCDLQDPPAMIRDFLDAWQDGHEIVYGVRRTRNEGFVITGLRQAFYRLINRLAEDELPIDAGDFRLVGRPVIEALRRMNDNHPYLRGAIAAMGFRQLGIPYERQGRQAGRSKFTLRQLVGLAVDGILAHSVLPLRLATLVGLVMGGLTFLALAGYSIARLFFASDWPPGFATTTVLILLSITLNALFLGVIGEYLGRIYQQVKKRPLTIVERSINDTPPPRKLASATTSRTKKS